MSQLAIWICVWLFPYRCVLVSTTEKSPNDVGKASNDSRGPIRGKCELLSIRDSRRVGNSSIILEGESLSDECECTGPSSEPIGWTLDNKKLPDDYGDIQSLVNGPWSKTSFFTFNNVTARQQGDLCCHQLSSSPDCVAIEVAKVTPNSTVSVTLKNVTLADEENGTAVVECTLTAFSKLVVMNGFMTLRINDVSDLVTFDPNPQSDSYKDRKGMTVWTMTYRFLKRVMNGDEMECEWTHQDISERLKSELTVNFSSLKTPATDNVNRTANETDSSLSTIAAIVVGPAVAVVIAFVAIFIICRRKSCRTKCQRSMKCGWKEANGDSPEAGTDGRQRLATVSPENAVGTQSGSSKERKQKGLKRLEFASSNLTAGDPSATTGKEPSREEEGSTEESVNRTSQAPSAREKLSAQTSSSELLPSNPGASKETLLPLLGPDEEQMNERDNRDHLDNLSNELGKSWLFLGRKLELIEATLQNIEADYRHQGQREVGLQMLLKWMNTIGGSRTTLYNAIMALDNGRSILESLLARCRGTSVP